MKHVLLAVVLAGVLGLMVAGCEQRPAAETTGESGAPPVYASSFDDGVDALNPNQFVDPVSGAKPIKQEFYADVEGKRVYFNSAESRDLFEKDPSEYMDALQM